MTKGTINVIWHSPDGSLHHNILPNLTKMSGDATKNEFDIVLWTDTQRLTENHKVDLARLGVKIRDYRECSSSRFYFYATFFLDKGFAGDKTAFALASDVLRIAILELAPPQEYCIYLDGNDIELIELDKSLHNLDAHFRKNKWGFSFWIEIFKTKAGTKLFNFRNDFLIASRTDDEFFKEFFSAYEAHLARHAFDYKKALTDREAQNFAATVTAAVNLFSVDIENEPNTLQTKFGAIAQQYMPFIDVFNASTYFTIHRHFQLGATWLPVGDRETRIGILKELGIEPNEPAAGLTEENRELITGISEIIGMGLEEFEKLLQEKKLPEKIEEIRKVALAIGVSSVNELEQRFSSLTKARALASIGLMVTHGTLSGVPFPALVILLTQEHAETEELLRAAMRRESTATGKLCVSAMSLTESTGDEETETQLDRVEVSISTKTGSSSRFGA